MGIGWRSIGRLKLGYDFEWSVERYAELLKVAGGKERMRAYFDQDGWPEVDDRDAFIKDLHKLKTDLVMEIIEGGELPLRNGIARITDEAIAAGMHVCACSTSNERAVTLVVEKMLGMERRAKFDHILAGDVVSAKKPDPEIYTLAATKLGIDQSASSSKTAAMASCRTAPACTSSSPSPPTPVTKTSQRPASSSTKSATNPASPSPRCRPSARETTNGFLAEAQRRQGRRVFFA